MKRRYNYLDTNWCLDEAGFDLPTKLKFCKELNIGLDLVPFADMQAVRDAGVPMRCVLPDMGVWPHGGAVMPFEVGLNDPEDYPRVYGGMTTGLARAALKQLPFMIAFPGNLTKKSRKVQWANLLASCTQKLHGQRESLVEMMERLGVTAVWEPLNIRGNAATWEGHEGIFCTTLDELVEEFLIPLGSKRNKAVADFYHLAMMDINPIDAVKKHHDHIGVVHVAGKVMSGPRTYSPFNRGPLNVQWQSIDYPTIMRCLADHTPPGMHVLIEHLKKTKDYATIVRDAEETISICESKL